MCLNLYNMPCYALHVMSCHVMSCHCVPRCYVDATGPGDAMEHDDNGVMMMTI